MTIKKGNLNELKIGIVGLGLIGGSLAKALKEKAGIKPFCGVDRNESTLRKAVKDGSIRNGSSDLSITQGCDILFICVPVSSIPDVLKALSCFYKGIVTDCASTKTGIYSKVSSEYPDMRYIGGHPMAGSEKAGYEASNANLFENAPYIVCSKNEGIEKDVLTSVIQAIGARPVYMDPYEHDKAVGLVSHLPHITAYALVDSVRSKGDDRLAGIAAGGFRDITRIASSDPELWADILSDSGDTILELIGSYMKSLKTLESLLRIRDKEGLVSSFRKAKEFRDSMQLPSAMKDDTVQLWVEIDDRPGMIARVAKIFADAGLNIRNIGIQDSREYEGGSLRVTLSSYEDALSGNELLKKEGMQVRIVR